MPKQTRLCSQKYKMGEQVKVFPLERGGIIADDTNPYRGRTGVVTDIKKGGYRITFESGIIWDRVHESRIRPYPEDPIFPPVPAVPANSLSVSTPCIPTKLVPTKLTNFYNVLDASEFVPAVISDTDTTVSVRSSSSSVVGADALRTMFAEQQQFLQGSYNQFQQFMLTSLKFNENAVVQKMGDLLSQSAQDSSRLRNELETSQQLTQKLLENSRLKEEIEWLHSRISKLENEKQSGTNRIQTLVAKIRKLEIRDQPFANPNNFRYFLRNGKAPECISL